MSNNKFDGNTVLGLTSKVTFNDNSQQTKYGTQANDIKKVILFAGDNGTSHAVLNKLIPELLEVGIEPVIFLTSGSNSPKAKIGDIKDFSFWETELPRIIYDYIENSYTLTNNNNEPREDLYYSPNQLAELYGVHIEKIDNTNDPSLTSYINEDPRILGSVSIKNYKLFSTPEIKSLKENNKFLWNLHTGELPLYRGIFIPVRYMQDNNYEYGWTLHEIDEGIDTGAIIDIRTRKIKEEATVLGAYYSMVEKGASMVADNVKLAAKGIPRPPIPQDQNEARYFSFPTAEEIKQLKDKTPPQHLYDEKETVDLYMKMFSDIINHAAHDDGLYMSIQAAIDDYKNRREIQKKPDLYVNDITIPNNIVDL